MYFLKKGFICRKLYHVSIQHLKVCLKTKTIAGMALDLQDIGFSVKEKYQVVSNGYHNV